MRFIDTDGLKCLGRKGFGPWQLDDGRLLRTAWKGIIMRTEEEARALFEVYKAVCRSGLGTPEPYEVVRTPDGCGVTVEYKQGIPLSLHLIFGSYTPEEAGSAICEVAKRIHRVQTTAGADWKRSFRTWAEDYSRQNPEEGADLIELVDSVPESSCLLHGDLHAANVIVLHGELSIIDVETAGYGSPLFDLALSRANIMYSIKAEDAMGLADEEALGKLRNAMWRTILEGYFEDAGEDELAEIDAKLERLAIYRRFQF